MGQYCSLPLMDVFSQRPDRYRTLEEGLSMAPAGADSRLLEIACGDGRAAMWFADKFGAGATGVDISKKRIAAARTMAAGSGADPAPEFICADFFSLPADEKYTHIYCEDFFSSLDEEHKRRFAGRVSEMLCPGGHLILCDFAVGEGGSEDENTQIDNIPCFVGIKKPETYCRYFEQAGLVADAVRDRSLRLYSLGAYLAKSYGVKVTELGNVLAGVENVEKDLSAAELEADGTEKQKRIKNFFVNARIAWLLMIFEKT